MKTNLLKVTLTCLVTLGAITEGLLGASNALADVSSLEVNSLDANAQSDKLVTQARRLIVDALPEERERAHESLIQAIRLSPSHIEAYAELSRFTLWQVSMKLMKPYALAQTASLARQVRDLDPNRPLGNYLLCEMMMALGQSKPALQLFEATRAEYPNHKDTAAFEARFYSESNPDQSLAAASRALGLGVSMDALSPAITVALENKSKQQSLDLVTNLKAFTSVYPDRWIWHRIGLALRDSRKYDEARTAFQKAIDLGNTVESRLHLGILYYENLGSPQSATAELETLLAVLKSKPGMSATALALVKSHLALAQLKAGEIEQAASYARSSFLSSPENEGIVTSILIEFEKAGKVDALERPLKELMLANPLLDFGHILLSQIASRGNDHVAADRHLTNAIAVRPERDDLYAARALTRYARKEFSFALQDFERAIRISPDQGSHYYNRACMLALLGRAGEAVASLREAVLLDSSFAAHARSDADFAQLRKEKNYEPELRELGVLEPQRTAPVDGAITAGTTASAESSGEAP
jgi:tetratricopeptide (TPR) repeat protein